MHNKLMYAVIVFVSLAGAPFALAMAEYPYKINFTTVLISNPLFDGNTRVEFDDTTACLEPRHQCFTIQRLPLTVCKEVMWKGITSINGEEARIYLGSMRRNFGPLPGHPACDSLPPSTDGDSFFEVDQGHGREAFRAFVVLGFANGWDPRPPL